MDALLGLSLRGRREIDPRLCHGHEVSGEVDAHGDRLVGVAVDTDAGAPVESVDVEIADLGEPLSCERELGVARAEREVGLHAIDRHASAELTVDGGEIGGAEVGSCARDRPA